MIEAGEDNGNHPFQRIPDLYVHIVFKSLLAQTLIDGFSNGASSEDPSMSWEFFVDHYEDQEQAFRDEKYTWRTPNNEYYVGINPPKGSEPLGILYPRAGTLGGCGNHNAGNLALPPDSDWDHIANVTGDPTWSAETMRGLFKKIENNQYVEQNSTDARGHGFDGWLAVSDTNYAHQTREAHDI